MLPQVEGTTAPVLAVVGYRQHDRSPDSMGRSRMYPVRRRHKGVLSEVTRNPLISALFGWKAEPQYSSQPPSYVWTAKAKVIHKGVVLMLAVWGLGRGDTSPEVWEEVQRLEVDGVKVGR